MYHLPAILRACKPFLQVSKDARGENKEGSSPNRKSPNSKGDKEAAKEAASEDAKPESKADAPQLATLLEFIAWLALQWREQESGSHSRRLSRRSSGLGWAAGRGGFLGDELEAVQEASVRLQVSLLVISQGPCTKRRVHRDAAFFMRHSTVSQESSL